MFHDQCAFGVGGRREARYTKGPVPSVWCEDEGMIAGSALHNDDAINDHQCLQ